MRIDELRQEGQEEERRLRVQDVDDDSVPVQPPMIDDRDNLDDALPRCEAPQPHHDQVGRAHVLHDRERRRRRDDQARDAGSCGSDVDERAGVQAEHRREAGALPAADALRDDVEHCGPGNHEQREGREHEERVRGR